MPGVRTRPGGTAGTDTSPHIVIEPDTGLVTAAAITKAAGEGATDAEAGAMLLEQDPTIPGEVQVLADSAYGTGELLRTLAVAGHTALIKPKPLAPAVEGGFTVDDFAYDQQARTLTCPNGLVRTITTKGRATFGAGCTGCPLRSRCTTAALGRGITLHPEHALLREHRSATRADGFQTDKRHRPMVERSIAWTVRGNRRGPYRGVANNHAWWLLRTAAVNLKRLLNLGLTRRNGRWAVA